MSLRCRLGFHDWTPTGRAKRLRERARQRLDEPHAIRFEVTLVELERECQRCGALDQPWTDIETGE